MRIAVIGAGAMGALYGGYLSRHNDVLLVDVNQAHVDAINERGLTIHEPDGSRAVYHPRAAVHVQDAAPADLVVLFVKAMFSGAALENCRSLIGPQTYLLTLQNGSGHEDTLLRFADRDHVIIGTTQHNSAVLGMGGVVGNAHAWALCQSLVREAVAVAAGDGFAFDEQEKIAEVRAVCERSPGGLTSIYADLRDGRKTEVDTISGSVVRASRRNGVPAPTHEAMVALVHAMEDRKSREESR